MRELVPYHLPVCHHLSCVNVSINSFSHGIDVKIHVPPQLRILRMILMVKQIVNRSSSDSNDQAISIFFLFNTVISLGGHDNGRF